LIDRNDRNYRLVIRAAGGDVTIEPPIKLVFDADKSIRGSVNKINLQIYNLTENKRLSLVKDAEERKTIPLLLEVGYQDSMDLIFKGTVHTGANERQGPDIVTTIEALDGGQDFLNAYTSKTVKGSREAVNACRADMTRTGEGAITERPPTTRPKVLVGNSARLIDDMVGPDETWYIDDEQLYIIKDDEVTSRLVPVVSAATGLISTPTRENKEVTFQTLMNPAVKIGQRVKLVSTTAPHLDGVYKINTINYSGDNYGEDWSQTCTCRAAGGARAI
jgi:hypothetical protein